MTIRDSPGVRSVRYTRWLEFQPSALIAYGALISSFTRQTPDCPGTYRINPSLKTFRGTSLGRKMKRNTTNSHTTRVKTMLPSNNARFANSCRGLCHK